MQPSNFLRNRKSSRAALAACAVVALVFFLNELRCVRHGCLRKTGFTGGWEQEEAQTSPDSRGAIEAKTMGWTGAEDAVPFGDGVKEAESQRAGQPVGVVEGRVSVQELQVPTPAHVVGVDGSVVHGGTQGAGTEAAVVQGGHRVQSGGEQNMGLGMGMGMGMGVPGLDGT
ncbi:uncharacterized protein BDZ99DRAFT_521930 [Mytilinidion resinicola]|uniref:Uncharacterized protein n=1 Tax=Mytilinidion resinicola TaxID=574789 RepID=A0A6A6YK85_9PEZI|nr:uncharacterized protein BDZ99DRAFT_521930 [Mytilinidion resinicola]KAF2808375.1 hypothetical protein BDZ99DRAFT_521930 [Mytilinidion resinicola]